MLARPEGARDGSRGLATFIVPSHLADGSSNGFRIKRLKPKLGTVAVPTGEVTLDGAARLAGGTASGPVEDAGTTSAGDAGASDGARDGRGINRMMEMVNGSRFGVALMGLGIHRRSWLEAAIYAARREQFGHRIDSYPLVRETLVDLLVDLEAGLALTFECAAAARLAPSPEEGALLRRIAIPLAKLRTCRVGLESAMHALEVFGGNGYMEDWPVARQLRDAQCHTIWEGTENICAIDVRRAMRSDRRPRGRPAPHRPRPRGRRRRSTDERQPSTVRPAPFARRPRRARRGHRLPVSRHRRTWRCSSCGASPT